MKQSFLLKISILVFLFTIKINFLCAQCVNQVTNLSGTSNINGISVTVTSAGMVWSSYGYCAETFPYFIGVNSGASSGNGSYSFNFSPAVDSLRLNFSGLSDALTGHEIVILMKNGAHYAIPQAGAQTICDALAILTPSGDIEACTNCNLSGWKGTVLSGPITSLQVIDSVVPAFPQPGGALFSLFIYSVCTTPVKFISCNAKKSGDNSLISWQTSFEQNNLEYEINRSVDGINYTQIGIVQSKNSELGGNYTFLDKKPLSGINYYQVVSTDFDGKITSCQINTVRFPLKENEINVYPIPTTDILTIENNFNSKSLNIEIIDISGKPVFKTKRASNFKTTISIKELPKGVYTLKVFSEGYVEYKKIVKV